MRSVVWGNINYRIYSRISREILDNIWPKFCQFDLYAGHNFLGQKRFFIDYLSVLSLFSKFEEDFKFLIFGPFLALIFSIGLICGLTYTRVYTVVY